MGSVTRIRQATIGDCQDIYQIHLSTIQYTCEQSYDATVLNAWMSLLSPNMYFDGLENKELWLIEYKGNTQGFFQLDLNNAELDALYVHPFVQNKGLGTAMIQEAENIAFSHNMDALKLYSSLNSVRFYQLNNYHIIDNYELVLSKDISIDCQLMQKSLNL